MAPTISGEMTTADLFRGDDIEPCEHPDHGTGSPFHADGGESFYVTFAVSPCGYQHGPVGVATVCAEWVRTIQGFHCGDCNTSHDIRAIMTVLGPVSDFR